ncbi:uncharacterized protein LOC127554005 [Antechinus flavipes]|uniref:uncharacterized protein LOC127554005 n=1 Tax=Antechinus flavipes TaxID=38775 RepID=UPI0022368A0A|nr:uncharacterized protein LOC127554005 [Antechinus flavipes]
MGKRQRLFPKASLVQPPSKDSCIQSNLETLPCPPPQLELPWEQDQLPRTEKMTNLNEQPSSNQLSLSSSCSTLSVSASSVSRLKGQAVNTGLFPKLKYQGMRRSFLPKKYHKNASPSPDFRTKAVERPTCSKQFVVPHLMPVHQSKTAVKLKRPHGVTSVTNPLPKISPCRDYRGKPKLPYLKHQPRPLAYASHRVVTAPPIVKQKRAKIVSKPSAPPLSRTSSSSLPPCQSHREVHRRSQHRGRITTALLGKLDLWPKNHVTESPSSEDHAKTTDSEKSSDQSDLRPKPPLQTCPFSKKERPIHRRSETALLSLTLNRNKPARPSFTKFISRGTNTYILWPQNKNTSQGYHQARSSIRCPSDSMIRPRAKSVPSQSLKVWETTVHQNMTTWPNHVAAASPGLDVKVKDTTGPSPLPVQPVTTPVPGLVQSNEITPDLNDRTTVSNGLGHQDATLVSQSGMPQTASVSTTPDVAASSLHTESTPSAGPLDKSPLIAGDHKPRDPFGFDQQVKVPINPHTLFPSLIFSEQAAESIIGLNFQALMELENQSTYEVKPDSQNLSQPNPNDQVLSSPILDHQSNPVPDDKAKVILSPDSHHWMKLSLTPDYQVSRLPSTNKLAEVESKFTTTQDLLPIDQEDRILQILPLLNPKESIILSSDPSGQKDTSSGNGDHQIKMALTFGHQNEAHSKLQYHDPIGENREIPWRLKYIKPYTIQGGTLSAATVTAIINSIPEKKIKSDMCKQILLRRMKESPPRRPGQRMTFSYTVCLECASWIPNGCPHVEGMNHLSETQLLAILMPLPGSEEMGVKFVLRVPKKKPFSLFSMLFPEYEMHWPSYNSSDLASSSNIESYGYPKVTRHQPSFLFSDNEPFECPQLTWHRPSSLSGTEPYEFPKLTRQHPSFSSSRTEFYECPQLTWHRPSSLSGTEPYEYPKVIRHYPSFSPSGIEPQEGPQVTWHRSSSSSSATEPYEFPKVTWHHPSSSDIEPFEYPKVTQHHPSSSSTGIEPHENPKVTQHYLSSLSSGTEPSECPQVTQHHASSSSSGTEPCECPKVTQNHPSSSGTESHECPQVTQHHPSSSGTEPRECPKVTQHRPSSSGTESHECSKVTQHRPSSSNTEPHEYPKVTWFDLLLGKDWQPSVKKSSKHRVSSKEETFKNREDDEKEKLRLLTLGFKSLLEKFEKQMKNC